MMIQEEEDPCFQGLMVLPATEKIKDNVIYPSCTIRDVNFRICGQFFLSFLSLCKFQIHGTGICFLNQRATELVGKMHWGNMKLISKTKGASVSAKTKNVIVDGNVDSSKVTHQRNSGIVHLTKRTEKNEASLIFPEGIKGVSRHDNSAKAFSRYQSWYNFSIFKSLSGYQHGVPYFNPREEQSLPVAIVGNNVLLGAFVNHYDRFQEEHSSEDGDGLNVSSMILSVCLAYDVWIVLQDAPLWFHHYPDHWITKHIGNCIHRIRDEDMQREIKIFMLNAVKNINMIQEEHDLHLRQNSIKESNINQHTSNCVSKIGVQISTIHSDNVNQNIVLKNLIKEVKIQSKMCMLTTKLVAKQNVVDEKMPPDLLKCWSECKGEPHVPEKEVSEMSEGGVSNEKNNDFYKRTAVSDHLLTCGDVDLNDKLGWATDVGCIIGEPHEVVDWWFQNRLHKELRKGAFKRLGKAVYNNLVRKKITWKRYFGSPQNFLMRCAMRS